MTEWVGEYVPTKFIWLMDGVEIVGTAVEVETDSFDIIPEPNYRHLISHFPGNSPLLWQELRKPAVMHLEAYNYDSYTPQAINHYEGWYPAGKPESQPFMVRPPGGTLETSRPLTAGDRVRVAGRWVIDHHPEYGYRYPPKFNPPEPDRSRHWKVGFLGIVTRYGPTHTELHPFDWQNIYLESDPDPSEGATCTLSIAAPLYEYQFIGDKIRLANEVQGVSGHVFMSDDDAGNTNYHTRVAGQIEIPGPDLSGLPANTYRKLGFGETVLKLGKDLVLDDVRSLNLTASSLRVSATVVAKRTGKYPDIHEPARGNSIFQARYYVAWLLAGEEVTCATRGPSSSFPPSNDNRPLIGIGGALANGDRWWLSVREAVEALRSGHNFYIRRSDGAGGEIRVSIVVHEAGSRTGLTTDPPPGPRFNPIRDLLECPPRPQIN